MSKLVTILNKFQESCVKQSPLFAYWDKFINSIFPILRELTTSFQQEDWEDLGELFLTIFGIFQAVRFGTSL